MIDYRSAVATDAAAVDDMARRVWVATFGHSAAPHDIDAYLASAYGPSGHLRRDLADPRFDFRIALEDGVVIGYCKIGPPVFTDEVESAGTVQLHQLYVEPAHHGHGVAATLLDWAIAHARRDGATGLLLTVWEENARAQRFYVKHGFRHVGDYAFRTGSQIDRDLILRHDL